MQRFLLSVYSIWFLLFASFIVRAQQRRSNISQGYSLTPTTNSSWLSGSGRYAFGFYRQGNGYKVGIFLAGIPEKTIVWTANRDDPPVPSNTNLLLNTEGKLVLQSTEGQDTDIVDISSPASSASMLDSGNFVLYSSDGEIIWQSFGHPTDTILPTQRLLPGKELFSSVSETDPSTGKFRLKMQQDGNLVQYPIDTPDTASYAYYASFTDGWGNNVTLNLDVDGRLYLLNSSSFNTKNLTVGEYPTGGIIYLMKIDSDGIFRLYSHNMRQNGTRSTVWESSKNKCEPMGLCGFNSFCVLNDQKGECMCVPGFAFVNQGNLTSGCERNFTSEGCSNRGGPGKYNIKLFDNTLWEDNSYFVLYKTTKEDCQLACMADCNCEVALFNSDDRECKMQRLPLRFGRRDMGGGSNNFAFIKVGIVSSNGDILPQEKKKGLRNDMIIILSCAFVALVFVMSAISGIVTHKFHVRSYRRIPGNGIITFCEDIAPISFSFAEIEKLTEGFKEEIGRGSSATVYKGNMMNCQKFVAVKKLEKVLAEGENEFLTEIKVIGKTHHRNLVRLLGYSFNGPNKVLVCEYMSNGSLADLLFRPGKKPNWIQRMGIVRDIARGILYLHDECETQIIHCDIKPQNILMDENMCAKISDFGLAKLLKPDQTNTFTGIRGTRGYVAPEWHRNLPVTSKVDVYSFGVVLLELICCRRSIDLNLLENQIILEDWVYACFETGELILLVGNEEVELKQLERVIKVALWCIIDEPSLRPSMKKVLLMLEGTVDIPIPPNPASYLTCI